MNTKTVIKKNSLLFEEKTQEPINIPDLYQLIKEAFTGKIKVIIHSPTTAGINAFISYTDDFTLNYDGVIRINSKNNSMQGFCINDLCNVNFENTPGRPTLISEKQNIELWFI